VAAAESRAEVLGVRWRFCRMEKEGASDGPPDQGSGMGTGGFTDVENGAAGARRKRQRRA
jgi:hypothetical protein